MLYFFAAILGIIVLFVLYVVGFYNRIKTLQVRIQASIQEIGNQLKRQADLIPNLVESVKGYMKHEKDIFTQLTEARKSIAQAAASNDPKAIDASQSQLSQVLSSLKVIVESNPQIQASSLVTDLMAELRDTADKVMYSRRTLIDVAADYNTSITTVPGIWFASYFGFKSVQGLTTPVEGKFLEVSAAETVAPQVKLD